MEMATVRSGAQALGRQTMEEAFPEADWRIDPMGNQVIVQMRMPKNKTAGGILLATESKDYDDSMIRVGKIVALGPIAYKSRETMAPWPEGAWVNVGDFVRVPNYAGVDAWRIHVGDVENRHGEREPLFVKFASFNDYDIKGRIKGDPLAIIDYV